MQRASEPSPRRGAARLRPRRPRAAAARARTAGRRDLRLAIGSGLVLAIAFLVSLVLHPYAFLTFVAAVIVVGLLEVDVALRGAGLRPATPLVVGAGLLMCYGAYAAGPSAQALGLVLLTFASLAWTLLDPGPARATSGTTRNVGANLAATFFMALWIPFLASFLSLLLMREDGEWAVMATVALTVSNDIGAYAFGSAWGRTKLAPRVSPAKTWEGLGGGLVTALIVAALVTSRVPSFDLTSALALAAAVVLAATLGDLAESLVKRDLGVKDLGTILPGHGGVMDRVDAVIFALPAAWLLLEALGT